MQWMDLVSEGHVHAARLRASRRNIFIRAIAFIVIGLFFAYIMANIPQLRYSATVNEAKYDRQVEIIEQFWLNVPGAALPSSSGLEDLTEGDVNTAAKTFLESLRETNKPPQAELIKQVNRQAFWKLQWERGQYYTTKTGRMIFVGAYVESGNQLWVAVYRKGRRDQDWRAYDIMGVQNGERLLDTPSLLSLNPSLVYGDLYKAIPNNLLPEPA